MLAQPPTRTLTLAMAQPVAAVAPEFEARLSLNRIAAALQVVLATRRAARNAEHAYWSAAGPRRSAVVADS